MCGSCFREWDGVVKDQSTLLYKGTRKRLWVARFTGGPVKKAERLGAHLVFIHEGTLVLYLSFRSPMGQISHSITYAKVNKTQALFAGRSLITHRQSLWNATLKAKISSFFYFSFSLFFSLRFL